MNKYQEALNRIEESYYDSDNSMGEMKRFNEDVNLLCGLVNEHFEEKDKHFEEKQETNLEFYYDDLLEEGFSDFGVVNGKIKSCAYIPCEKCEFEGGNCNKNRIIWLTSKCKKRKHKFTQFEYDLINTYRNVDDRCKFNDCYQLESLKEKGYFKNVDKNELIKDIIENCEVV